MLPLLCSLPTLPLVLTCEVAPFVLAHFPCGWGWGNGGRVCVWDSYGVAGRKKTKEGVWALSGSLLLISSRLNLAIKEKIRCHP